MFCLARVSCCAPLWERLMGFVIDLWQLFPLFRPFPWTLIKAFESHVLEVQRPLCLRLGNTSNTPFCSLRHLHHHWHRKLLLLCKQTPAAVFPDSMRGYSDHKGDRSRVLMRIPNDPCEYPKFHCVWHGNPQASWLPKMSFLLCSMTACKGLLGNRFYYSHPNTSNLFP